MSQCSLRSLLAIVAGTLAIVGAASAGTGTETWNFDQLAAWQPNTAIEPNWAASPVVDSQTFTQGSDTLTATAVIGTSNFFSWTISSGKGSGNGPCSLPTSPCVYDKSGSTLDEVGLGLTPDGKISNDREIYYDGVPYGIGVQSSVGSQFLTSFTLGSYSVNSNGKDESWALDGCTGTFTGCTALGSGVGGTSTGILTLNLNPTQAYASYVFFVPCANQSSCSTMSGTGSTSASNNFLLSSVTLSNTAPVPEPPNWLLFIVGTGLVGLMTCRRRGRAPV